MDDKEKRCLDILNNICVELVKISLEYPEQLSQLYVVADAVGELRWQIVGKEASS